jgi:hypothetical protein
VGTVLAARAYFGIASLAKPVKMQSRVNFPDFSSSLFSNSKSDTT